MDGIEGHVGEAQGGPAPLSGGRQASPRVLICIPTLGSGGAERQVRLLGRRLVARGIPLSLFSRMGEVDIRDMEAGGVRCFPIRAPGNHNPLMAIELWRALRTSRAAIVHSFLPQMDIVAGGWALLAGKLWLLSERSSPLAYCGGLKNAVRARLGRHAAAIVANSAAGLAVWPDARLHPVIPNGLDLTAIDAAPSDREGERAVLAGRTVILSVARLAPEKKLDQLIEATALLSDRLPGLLTVLIGAGPEADALRALADRRGIGGHVHFAGYRADVWSWMKQASVFVGPSLFEGHPNAVLEAAAAGIPQILTDIPMHRDAVGDGGALFVPVGDAGALADAILVQIEGHERAADMAAAARAHVEPLSIERAADRFAALYRQLAKPV